MIEFTFGIYNPLNGALLNTDTPEGLEEYLDLENQGLVYLK